MVTDKKTKALKLALDYIVATNKSSQFWLVPESNLNRTVTAIREALAEQPAQQWTDETAKVPDHVWDGRWKALEQKRKADSALDRMADNARELGLDYEPIVERVENSVGMGHKAWDMVEPKELAKAFHEALAEQPAQQPVTMDDAIAAGDSVLMNEQAALLRECRAALDSLIAQKPTLAVLLCGSTTLGNLKAELHAYRPQGVFGTSPQPSKPLTDEQIKEIMWQKLGWTGCAPDDINFARAIEAAHGIKEKNNG